MDFLFTYHPIWLVAAVLIALGYSFLLYRKDELLEEVGKKIKLLLAAFRFLAVFIIAILLIGIILEKFIDRKENPMLFVVNDNSASVLLNQDSTFYKTTYLEDLKQFSKNLEERFEIVNYDYADELSPGFSGDYSGKSSDLSLVFNQIFDQYSNRNIGGVVVASDGIYNSGANPLYAISRKSFLPIFTIGLGDTNQVKDVRVDRVNHNDIAFLGNEFPIEISCGGIMCANETVTVSVFDGDQLLKSEKVTFQTDDEQVRVPFVLKASRIGFRKYRAVISSVDNEYGERNNTANFYVEVIDGRQKILIASQAPHPDIGALNYVIDNNKNYEVVSKRFNEIDNLKAFDLIIAHNYNGESELLTNYIKNGDGAVLFIVGAQTDLKALSRLEVGFSGAGTNTEEVNYSHNPNYKEILVSANAVQMLSSAPPLKAPFGSFKFSSAIEVLAYQKVGNIKLEQPLIYFTQKRNNRMGVVFGDGIWRWRLYDQMKNRSTDNFNEFFGKLITFLAVKENKDPFKVQVNNEFTENEAVIVKAELYNKSFDLINEPEVAFTYSNENGDQFESFFVKSSNAYQLDLGKLKQGVYSWQASTTFQGEKFSKKGTFLVREVKIEFLNAVADHRVLRNIAQNSGGQFFFPSELKELEAQIKSREDMVTVVYQEKEFDDLIDYKWLFILIVLLLSVEWFIRKYQGAY